jgi:hypothetical protein
MKCPTQLGRKSRAAESEVSPSRADRMRPAAAFASVLLPPRAVGPSLVAASRSPPAAAATTYGEINTTS